MDFRSYGRWWKVSVLTCWRWRGRSSTTRWTHKTFFWPKNTKCVWPSGATPPSGILSVSSLTHSSPDLTRYWEDREIGSYLLSIWLLKLYRICWATLPKTYGRANLLPISGRLAWWSMRWWPWSPSGVQPSVLSHANHPNVPLYPMWTKQGS